MTAFFFDLDGTLTDSRDGLFIAFRAGLAAIGAPLLPDSALQAFLGTPLPQIFATARPGISPVLVQAGIDAFRAAYEADGIFRNTLYPGVDLMLGALRRTGHDAWLVTSKPEPHALRVVALLGLGKYLNGVVGAGLRETDTKTELVARALGLSGADPATTIMLGDRSYDIVGARENGVRPVGALWGYGTEAELRAAGCRAFVASAEAFTNSYIPAAAYQGVAA
jgi:phosphoglycolate phosphatase